MTVTGIMLCIHIVSCFWYMTANIYNFHPDTWVMRGGYANESNPGLYLRSVYWSITTVTAIGYGEIHPRTPLERILAIVWMIAGLYFLSFTISSLSSTLTQVDNRENMVLKKLAIVDTMAKELLLN